MSEKTPREVDTRLAELYALEERARSQRDSAMQRLHREAGDMRARDPQGKTCWQLTDREALELAQTRSADPESPFRHGAGRALTEWSAIVAELVVIREEQRELDAIYLARLWNRYFLVTNGNGHVHREMTCRTCFPTTQYAWLPELSGCDEAEMITEFGEKACTVCFPDAPANPAFHAPGRRDREVIEARQAEKLVRQAVKDAKRLAADEVFRTTDGRNRIETVAACKELVRKPLHTTAELAHYRRMDPATAPGWSEESLTRVTGNIERMLASQLLDAAQAARVLMAREERHEGHGATSAEIGRMIDSATKRAQREWAA